MCLSAMTCVARLPGGSRPSAINHLSAVSPMGDWDSRRFGFYVCQDDGFLIEHGRVLALACALEWMEQFADPPAGRW
jgi:hypothetical protein